MKATKEQLSKENERSRATIEDLKDDLRLKIAEVAQLQADLDAAREALEAIDGLIDRDARTVYTFELRVREIIDEHKSAHQLNLRK